MLGSVENHLVAAIAAIHPAEQAIHSGPLQGPASDATSLIAIIATSLRTMLPKLGEGADDAREPAYSVTGVPFEPDGTTLDFAVPDHVPGAVTEVETPTGQWARVGDDYRVDGRVVKFYRAPTESLVIHVRGDRIPGYREIGPCQVTVDIIAWAENPAAADNLLVPSLSAALATLDDVDLVTLGEHQQTGARYRLLDPGARLQAIERTTRTVSGKSWIHALARLDLRARLEVQLGTGDREPGGTIEDIAITARNK